MSSSVMNTKRSLFSPPDLWALKRKPATAWLSYFLITAMSGFVCIEPIIRLKTKDELGDDKVMANMNG